MGVLRAAGAKLTAQTLDTWSLGKPGPDPVPMQVKSKLKIDIIEQMTLVAVRPCAVGSAMNQLMSRLQALVAACPKQPHFKVPTAVLHAERRSHPVVGVPARH